MYLLWYLLIVGLLSNHSKDVKGHWCQPPIPASPRWGYLTLTWTSVCRCLTLPSPPSMIAGPEPRPSLHMFWSCSTNDYPSKQLNYKFLSAIQDPSHMVPSLPQLSVSFPQPDLATILPLYHGWALSSGISFYVLVCLLLVSFFISWSPLALATWSKHVCVLHQTCPKKHTWEGSGSSTTLPWMLLSQESHCWKSSGASWSHSQALSCGSSSALGLWVPLPKFTWLFLNLASLLKLDCELLSGRTSSHLCTQHSSTGFSRGLFHTTLAFSWVEAGFIHTSRMGEFLTYWLLSSSSSKHCQLLTITKSWKQHRYPSASEWVKYTWQNIIQL